MKVIAMITARSGSRRFPRKHLADLGGSPMIVQIIRNLQNLSSVDQIVLATSKKDLDDELASVAAAAGAYVCRGSERDLVQRHGLVLQKTDAECILDISGDCPFQDIRALQLVVDTMISKPGFDCYAISGPYAAAPEMLAGGHTFIWYHKVFEMYNENKDKYSSDQYWIASNEHPERLSTYTVDGSHLMSKSVTPMKLSIDWDIERQFFNKIINFLGYYPNTIDDFNKAFTEMEVL